MTKVALRGLAQRKLRAFVTALAVLLGVALIAGSYVLTDTINSRSTRSSTRPTRAPTSRSPRARPRQGDRRDRPPFPERYLDGVRKVDGVREGRGRHLLGRPLRRREGRPAQHELRARVHLLDAPEAASTRSPTSRAARRGPPSEVSLDKSTRRPRAVRASATRCGSPAEAGVQVATGSSGIAAARRHVVRRREHRAADAARGAAAHRQGGRARRDLGRRPRRASRRRAAGPAHRRACCRRA